MTATGKLALAIGALFVCSACGSSKEHLLKLDESQVEMRSMQTRAFDTTDKEGMLRTVISTLQDLGYIVNEANEVIGTVSARTTDIKYKLFSKKKLPLLITVTVRPRGETQLLVRANAQFDEKAVRNPLVYQNFFNVLEKSIYLSAHEVD
ncbi:MAG: hypothetical protein OXU79_00470 [Gemmatimonadota bacterium]|nr:hypothetical protein [Gemmatimonadota bacterium]